MMVNEYPVAQSSQHHLQIRKLSRAIEQNPSIVIITDVNGRIEYVNPRFIQVTKFTADEVIGKTPRVLQSDKTSIKTYQILWDTISSGLEWRGDLLNKKKNGDYYWVATSISPIKDDSGEITHFVGVQEDITDRKRIERENSRLLKTVQSQHDQLMAQAKQLRQLAHQVVTMQEAERYRVSRELHDETSQMLTLLKISLETLKIDLTATENDNQAVSWKALQKDLEESIDLCEQTMNQIRMLAHDLRPSALDDLGLNSALKALCKDFRRHSHLHIEYSGTDVSAAPENIGISFYRVLQEALTNVIKHAQADYVKVKLEKGAGGINLHIEDNGKGFTGNFSSQTKKGIGLLSMTERLESLGGQLAIKSVLGQGTTLLAFVPQEV